MTKNKLEANTETDIMKLIRQELGSGKIRLFRNNVGQARTETGAVVVFGLCKGSSDLIGWKSVEITSDMIGKRVAIFTALEVKKPGKKPDKDQRNFIAVVAKHGGISGVAVSIEQAREVLQLPPSEK